MILINSSSEVTHVVTEFDTYEQAMRHLNITSSHSEDLPDLLNISWFTESIKARKPVEILDRHRLPRDTHVNEVQHIKIPSLYEGLIYCLTFHIKFKQFCKYLLNYKGHIESRYSW